MLRPQYQEVQFTQSSEGLLLLSLTVLHPMQPNAIICNQMPSSVVSLLLGMVVAVDVEIYSLPAFVVFLVTINGLSFALLSFYTLLTYTS